GADELVVDSDELAAIEIAEEMGGREPVAAPTFRRRRGAVDVYVPVGRAGDHGPTEVGQIQWRIQGRGTYDALRDGSPSPVGLDLEPVSTPHASQLDRGHRSW